MRRLFIAAFLMLLAVADARGQTTYCVTPSGMTPCNFLQPSATQNDINTWPKVNVGRVRTGDPDLDRAMAICDAHSVVDGNADPIPFWQPAYEKSCAIALDRWEKSDAARQQRETDAKEAEDRAFLEKFVGDGKGDAP